MSNVNCLKANFALSKTGASHCASIEGFLLSIVLPAGAVVPVAVSRAFFDEAKAQKVSHYVREPALLPAKKTVKNAEGVDVEEIVRDADGNPVLILMGHAKAQTVTFTV